MSTRIILPYDGSTMARVALRRAAAFAATGPSQPMEIVLAVPGEPGDCPDGWRQQAHSLVAEQIPIGVAFLRSGDEQQYLSLLLECNPKGLFAFPVCPEGNTGWYAATLGNRAAHPSGDTLVMMIGADELRRPVVEVGDGRSRLGRVVRGILRARPRLHPGVRPHVGAAQ